MANLDTKLFIGESDCAKLNIGKNVQVNLISGIKTLNIISATKYMGEFRYVMHTAKKPRKDYIHEDNAIHANIHNGYYIVCPFRIIF